MNPCLNDLLYVTGGTLGVCCCWFGFDREGGCNYIEATKHEISILGNNFKNDKKGPSLFLIVSA